MIAADLINRRIPHLNAEDDITLAKQLMDDLKLSELPVVNSGDLLGFITEDLLFDAAIIKAKVGEYPLIANSCNVGAQNHYFDVLKVLNRHEVSMVAVHDFDGKFLGIILMEDLFEEFSNTAFVKSSGAIVVLRSSLNDYSLAEIARITEMNGSTILGANVIPDIDDPSLIDILLRINHQDITQITSGLSKSGYQVTATYNTEDKTFDEKNRYGQLMKFLDL
ncbi:MAG: CBS domain-containing protein [Bacteroidota bacterium]